MEWSSDKPEVATVDPTAGLITGVGDGVAVITATLDRACGQSLQTTITVHVVAVASVEIRPSESILRTNKSSTLHTILRDPSGNPIYEPVDVALPVDWKSSDLTVVSLTEVSKIGEIVANAQDKEGFVTITAKAGGKVGTATIEVCSSMCVEISPPRAAAQVGNSVVFIATAKDAQGNVVVPEPSKIHWSIEPTSVATLTKDGMQASALAIANTELDRPARVTIKIDGASPGITVGTATAVLEVRPKVVLVEVTPKRLAIPIGSWYQFTVVGKDADGKEVTHTADAWSGCLVDDFSPDGFFTAHVFVQGGCSLAAMIDGTSSSPVHYDSYAETTSGATVETYANAGPVNKDLPTARSSHTEYPLGGGTVSATATATACIRTAHTTAHVSATTSGTGFNAFGTAGAYLKYIYYRLIPAVPIPEPPDEEHLPLPTVKINATSVTIPDGVWEANALAQTSEGTNLIYLGLSTNTVYLTSVTLSIGIGEPRQMYVTADCIANTMSEQNVTRSCHADIKVSFEAPPGYKLITSPPPQYEDSTNCPEDQM